jgi:Rnl2 family RNA ligase
MYEKIPESTSAWTSLQKTSGWVVTEKVHGACFCFLYNTKTMAITCAKRKQILDDSDDFFGYKAILGATIPLIKDIGGYIADIHPHSDTIAIYGELFGGIYPDIPGPYRPVQVGIYYSPNLHFYAFDISIISMDEEKYIDYSTSLQIFARVGILHAKPLATYRTYEETLGFSVGFNSTLPKALGLPELELNKAEGVVVRSLEHHYLVKRKIPEFSETKYSENNYKPELHPATELELYIGKAQIYMTSNRLNNASSKIGSIDKAENLEEIYDTFVNDILYELNAFHICGLYEALMDECRRLQSSC